MLEKGRVCISIIPFLVEGRNEFSKQTVKMAGWGALSMHGRAPRGEGAFATFVEY